MNDSTDHLRRDAIRIWQAGLEAVRSERLIHDALQVENGRLRIVDQRMELAAIERIVVVGAGKAGAGMAVAVEEALGPELLAEKRVEGWVNVPADCLRPTARIHLHPARPAGVNEPTPEAAAGAAEILRLVGALGPPSCPPRSKASPWPTNWPSLGT
jgi:hydroxypyruvate reductase